MYQVYLCTGMNYQEPGSMIVIAENKFQAKTKFYTLLPDFVLRSITNITLITTYLSGIMMIQTQAVQYDESPDESPLYIETIEYIEAHEQAQAFVLNNIAIKLAGGASDET